MIVDGSKLGEVGFKYLGVPYSEMDCQAFVEKCLSDCGMNKDLPGSNAWYRLVHENGWTGSPEECVKEYGKVPSGAFLFIVEHDGKEPDKYKPDGLGNASHIGLCTGSQGEGAIHSSSSRGCVAESKFAGKTIKNGGWNTVGLWDNVDYGLEPSPEPEPTPEPEYAVVYAENGKPVKMRAKPSTNCELYWKIPVGEVVTVLADQGEWTQIRWDGITGYMMTKFLMFDSGEEDRTYAVTICGLTQAEATAIAKQYPGAEITEERG